ncbi:F-box only protein 43 [Heptranchias perlo]|uniref:F-box only protein 43 n=1 Tax=Heptranchias perlo TaxID=212740 RepID=UPI00355ABCB5
MLSLLAQSCDLSPVSEQQGADPEESSKSFGDGSLRQDSGYDEGESTTTSVNYSSGTIGELDSLIADLSPVVWKEKPFHTGRPSSFSIERKRLDGKRTNSISPILFETPRITGKTITLRRRLLESQLASSGSVELCKTLQSTEASMVEWSCTRICYKDSPCSLYSPGDLNFEALATSTLSSEESGTSFRTKRYLFAQQRTSTIDDLKCRNQLMPAECVTLDQSTIYSKLDLSSFSCSGDYDRTSAEPFETPSSYGKPTIPEGNQFLTPVNNFVVNLNINLSERTLSRIPSHGKLDSSITEDSGYNSVGLEKSDSFSNDDISFQELVENQKKTPKVLDCEKSQRKLERIKRLSTLRERGSQSEAEDENRGAHLIGSDYNLKALGDSVSKENELVFEEETWEVSRLKFEDLSRTPALQLVQEMCMRKRKRPGDTTVQDQSLSEEKELAESMPSLTRLIGRKMGLEKVDILRELFSRNLTHILTLILCHLTVEDIYGTRRVSKVWKKVVQRDQAACLKRKQYLDKIGILRVHSLPWAADAETRHNLPSRSALKSVQAQARVAFTPTLPAQQEVTLSGCSNLSRSTSKREEFLKVAKTLFNDEALKPCPRCQSPARYNPMKKRGLCSRDGCAFDFCTQCFCVFHGSKECGSRSAKRLGNKEGPPGSAQSKRNLKRL